jgi:transcriptional regulator with XRE-family HTH domain
MLTNITIGIIITVMQNLLKFNKSITIIRQLRETLKLSQSELAKNLSISQGLISHFENKHRKMSIGLANKIIKFAYARNIFILLDDLVKDYLEVARKDSTFDGLI